MQLILASSSPYRANILKRLGQPFDQLSPEIDESPETGESPKRLVQRLAEQKARAVAQRRPDGLIIASDQVAVFHGRILGKPGSLERAAEQLRLFSGQTILFYTSVALFNARSGRLHMDLAVTEVVFRDLEEQQILSYLHKEQPYDCAGAFKSEGLGAALLAKIVSDDPDALIGLPLLRLITMLKSEGLDPLLCDRDHQ
jgi:septum formation protein